MMPYLMLKARTVLFHGKDGETAWLSDVAYNIDDRGTCNGPQCSIALEGQGFPPPKSSVAEGGVLCATVPLGKGEGYQQLNLWTRTKMCNPYSMYFMYKQTGGTKSFGTIHIWGLG